ncbi:DNA replication and repair protein RecF [Bacteroidia bacterium]|nr:DNA replication and repair protein RecF [Bacteroidia bacterium]
MYIKSIYISNFKNYENREFEFSGKINCVVGNNAVGKTNLLDAIHYLSNCKSFVNLIDNLNIRHGEDFFAITGHFTTESDSNEKLTILVKKGEKKVMKSNDKIYDRLIDHIGKFPTVVISPYDSDIINEAGDIRRKFLDMVISQFDRNYLENLVKYNATVQQRNKILKDFTIDQLLLEILNDKMVKFGLPIYNSRAIFLSEFVPIFRKYYHILSGGKEKVDIVYHSQLNDNDFLTGLNNSLESDKFLKYSTFGTHKDDLKLFINDLPVKKYASQGQQKSFTISMRLAQFEIIKQKKNFTPILILDDIFDKLDEQRVSQLIACVGNEGFGQVFISDVDHSHLKKIIPKDYLAKFLHLNP